MAISPEEISRAMEEDPLMDAVMVPSVSRPGEKSTFSAAKIVGLLALLLVGMVAGRCWLAGKTSGEATPVDESNVEVESKVAEVDNVHTVPGYLEYAHVNCYEFRGATSAGISEVELTVQSPSECAVHCNSEIGRCSGFVIFYRYRPFKCWLRSSIAEDKGICQQDMKDASQDVYHFSTYEKLSSSVRTAAFPGTIQFQGKCLGVDDLTDGTRIQLLECGSQDTAWLQWEARPGDRWKAFQLIDFPSASLTGFRLKGTDKCLDVHDHADWERKSGLDSKMNYLQIWTCGVDERAKRDQQWIILQSADHVGFQLQWRSDPKLGLDVPGGKNTVGNHIQIYKLAPDWPNQVFQNY
mmetsp:Transcript_6690/g.15504  ORF Transcript_6690/g.15504 Transcript_6690/m.15504 type:complete len:353 (-) Transcript_6690:157-1215(-)